MSNYTQTTFFTPKDSLPITDPNKTIFGAAYDVEFANIAASLVSKLDAAFVSPALLSLNVTSTAIPPNGISLQATNVLGLFANSTLIVTLATGGVVFGAATGGAQGVGTINATGLFVNGVAVGAAAGTYAFVVKPADTSRASTTVIADDPDLQIAFAAGHVFDIEFGLEFNQTAGGTGGLSVAVRYSGAPTLTTSALTFIRVSAGTYAMLNVNMAYGAGYGAGTQIGDNGGAGTSYTHHTGRMILSTVGGAGTLFLGWAQAVSDAHPSTVKSGSWLRYKQIQ